MADAELLGEEEEEEIVADPIPEEVEEEHVEEESILTEYDPDDFISGAVNSLDSTIPLDLFEFEYSYGYNCLKYFNLCACDDSVVCWAAGSIITFMDANTKQTWFRRSTTGGSVGHITSYRKDPNYRLAIAEGREGDREPLILLYTWPQMEIDAVLRDGTTNAYSVLDFSPDGELLASVGKEPDYNLTIWTWKKHRILLRTSAFTFDVNGVMFSPYCPGQLTTAGAAHIKFWKMAETFTGLKLKGELGRFGKTEICDVLGVYPMPDEKVLSGCEWGNVLVWEAGLVKLEVTQRGRKTCHKGPVIQFMLSPAGDEVTTIARDGCVRAWYWDTVEQADPPEDDPYVELNPVAETCVPDCQIMCLKHRKDLFWYAQDGNGGIWNVELEIDKIQCDHRKFFTSHAGGVVGMAALRTHPILVTAGEDGALLAYDTKSHVLLARYHFPTKITCLLYPPVDVDETNRILILGFADGIIRTLFLHPERLQNQSVMLDVRITSALTIHSQDSEHADVIDLISILKPHSKDLVQITINEPRTLLVTCGQDSTIFMYSLEKGTPFQLHRLGFIETPNNIAFMTWKPEEERVLLLCGQVGLLMEAVLPEVPIRKYTEITTFKLDFVSYNETLVKKNFMRHRPFPNEEDLASIDEEALKAKEEAEKERKDDDEEEEYLGEIQLIESESMLGTTLTWAHYCEEGVWVVQKGTGALFLVKPGNNKIIKYGPIAGAWCDDLTALRFICDNRYLIVATNTGYIRVVRMPTKEEDSPEHHVTTWMMAQQKLLKKLKGRRLAKEEPQPTPRIDFDDNYYLPIHDRYTGAVTCLEFSSDGKYFYTCGADGNIFSFAINFPEPLLSPSTLPLLPELPKVQRVKEVSTVDGEIMSHEQLKQKEEYDKMMAIANAHKKRVRDQLAELTAEYNKLIKANRVLPVSQQIDVTLDPRPLAVQEAELDDAKALTKRKLAHQLEASDLGFHKMYSRNIIQLDVFPFTLKAIRDPEVKIRPLRQKNLSKAFYDQLEEVYQKMAEAALRGRRAESTTRRTALHKTPWGPPRVASFLLGMPPNPPHPLKKALRNYHQRLNRHHQQFIEWQEHLALKPDPNAMPPGAAEALKEAEATIGNKLLKTQPDYVAPPGHNTQLRVCLARKEIFETKRAFNVKVLELRDHKIRLVEQMKQIGERLNEIRMEIPPNMAKQPPPLPDIDEDLEFPEKNLEVKPEKITLPQRAQSKKQSTADVKKPSFYPQARIRQPKVHKFVPITETRPLAATWEVLKLRPDQEPTQMEIEIRERRIERHLYEQNILLDDAEIAVQKFDSRLKQLQRERIRVQEKNLILELHLYQLHREMNVLNRFEAHEDRLAERVYAKLMQVRGVQDQIIDCEHRIEEHRAEKVTLDHACQELQRQFKKLVQDNKFADFLRRIFKKKYRPPRDHQDDESSEEEESSSSSEEEEEGSIDSRDIGPIRLDPNVCPEGCDPDIYNKTYDLRNTRHHHEQQMLEQDRLVEMLRKDIDAHHKVKRKLSVQLDQRKNDLREFMMEKQSCMNDVTQVIILRYDQIRASAIRGCTGPQGLSKTVVFPEQMLSRLRRRVLELQDEIKQQKQRQKVNRTHLFRMNIDLRAMEAEAEQLRAKMRDVLTRKLGRPRRVDRTLDDLLRQMARRHKFSATLDSLQQIFVQLRQWRERHSELEKKYLKALAHYSDKLRLAAALQSEVLPQKPQKDPMVNVGGYDPEQYNRDVVRLKIVRAQQVQQIKQLQEEVGALRLKPLSYRTPPPAISPPESDRSDIYLFMVPRSFPIKKRYFPMLYVKQTNQASAVAGAGDAMAPGGSGAGATGRPAVSGRARRAPRAGGTSNRGRQIERSITTPLGSHVKLVYDVNIQKLLFDCLDSMRVSRDEAEELLHDLTMELPAVISGSKSRYEVVDALVRKWLLRYGGDPSQYKKQTRAFDALAALTDRIIRQHVETMEGPLSGTNVMESLEAALKDVAGKEEPLHERLAPAVAALFYAADIEDLESEETMTSLIHSLVDEKHPLTADAIDCIQVSDIIKDIRDCGIEAPHEELEHIIMLAIECLRAQLVTPEETIQVEEEAQQAMSIDVPSVTTSRSSRLSRRDGRQSHGAGQATHEQESVRDENNQNEDGDKNANDIRFAPSVTTSRSSRPSQRDGRPSHGASEAIDEQESVRDENDQNEDGDRNENDQDGGDEHEQDGGDEHEQDGGDEHEQDDGDEYDQDDGHEHEQDGHENNDNGQDDNVEQD